MVRTIHILLLASLLLVHSGNLVAHAEGASGDTPDSTNLYIPLAGNQMCNGNVTQTPFGVQMYWATTYDSRYHVELMESGASWVRVPVYWRSIEPVDSDVADFNWQSADQMLGAAKDGCLNIVATHRSNPSWASYIEDGPVFTNALPDLSEYMAALVERYDGDGIDDAPGSPVVQYWEIYNEPDVEIPLWMWGSHPELYAEMLKTVYPAIKAANPDAKVVIGGLGYDYFTDQGGTFNRKFLEEVVETGGGDYFDVMNFHYFPAFAHNWTDSGSGLLEKTSDIKKMMHRLDLDKPIIVTESGHYANNEAPYYGSEEIQMRYLIQLFTQAQAAGIDFLIWYALYDIPTDPHYMGLVTNEEPTEQRSAYLALQYMADLLGNAEYYRKLPHTVTLNDQMEAYEFHDPVRERTIYVAWMNPVYTGDVGRLWIKSELAIASNAFGTESMVFDNDDGDDDGRVLINVGARPLYVVVEWWWSEE